MGGCCCTSRKAQLQGTPVYYYVELQKVGVSQGLSSTSLELGVSSATTSLSFSTGCPPALEEQGTFRSYNHSAPGLSAGLLVGLNLDTSSPDTYRAPPAPIPFNVLFGRPRSPLGPLQSHTAKCGATEPLPESKLISETAGAGGFGSAAPENDADILDKKTLADILLASPAKSGSENAETKEHSELESQECPICLEVYDADNPKMTTNCEHEFHLSCILEWMERSYSCPVCDKEMAFDHTIEQP